MDSPNLEDKVNVSFRNHLKKNGFDVDLEKLAFQYVGNGKWGKDTRKYEILDNFWDELGKSVNSYIDEHGAILKKEIVATLFFEYFIDLEGFGPHTSYNVDDLLRKRGAGDQKRSFLSTLERIDPKITQGSLIDLYEKGKESLKSPLRPNAQIYYKDKSAASKYVRDHFIRSV